MPKPKKETKLQRKKRLGILGMDVALAKRGLLGKGYSHLSNDVVSKRIAVLYKIAQIEGQTW